MSTRKRSGRQKHVPQRTCIACRQVAGKRALVRLVRTGEGAVTVDETGKAPGRGAYLHADPACWRKALESRRIEQALRTSLTADDRRQLEVYLNQLPPSPAED